MRVALLLFVATAVVALAGCGGDEDGPASTEGALEAALASLGDRDSQERETAVEATDGGAVVTVTFEGLFDDSVRAERNVVELERTEDGGWRVVGRDVTYACRQGRGHEDFSAELCL